MTGLLAECIGVFRSYDLFTIVSGVLLAAMPSVAAQLPHGQQQHSVGFKVFFTLLCIVGLMVSGFVPHRFNCCLLLSLRIRQYGGAVALFYSIIFDVYGPRNYRNVFAVTSVGFGFAVLVGGLSSGYSFSGGSTASSTSSAWFYAMAVSCGLGLLLLHLIQPYKYMAPMSSSIQHASVRNSKTLDGEYQL